jgi:hypothetical protein
VPLPIATPPRIAPPTTARSRAMPKTIARIIAS